MPPGSASVSSGSDSLDVFPYEHPLASILFYSSVHFLAQNQTKANPPNFPHAQKYHENSNLYFSSREDNHLPLLETPNGLDACLPLLIANHGPTVNQENLEKEEPLKEAKAY